MNKQEFSKYQYLNRKIDGYRHRLPYLTEQEINRLDQYLKERDELIKERMKR